MLPEIIWTSLPYGDWVPRVSIPWSEAQVETISPLVNQPWKPCSVTIAAFYLSRPSKGLSDFQAKRKRSYLLRGEVVRF